MSQHTLQSIQQIIANLKPSIPAGWNLNSWSEDIKFNADMEQIENKITIGRRAPHGPRLMVRYNSRLRIFECTDSRILKFLAKISL